ncbi:MAG: hypothetical protein WBW49_18470, partial [Candidatus Acidiferrum sp.]
GVYFAGVNGDDFSSAAALIGSAIPDASSTFIDDTDRPGLVAVAGVFVDKLHNSKAFEMGDLRQRPGACRASLHT